MARKPPLSSPAPKERPPAAPKPSTREGKRAFAFWIDAAAYEEAQIAVVRLRTTIQAAGEEMLADWMQKHGMKLPE